MLEELKQQCITRREELNITLSGREHCLALKKEVFEQLQKDILQLEKDIAEKDSDIAFFTGKVKAIADILSVKLKMECEITQPILRSDSSFRLLFYNPTGITDCYRLEIKVNVDKTWFDYKTFGKRKTLTLDSMDNREFVYRPLPTDIDEILAIVKKNLSK